MVSKAAALLTATEHVGHLTVRGISDVLRKLGFDGRDKGVRLENGPLKKLAGIQLEVNRIQLTGILECAPLDKVEKQKARASYSVFHVQWILWDYFSTCLGLAVRSRSVLHLTADWRTCPNLLAEVAAATDAEVIEFGTDNEMRDFIGRIAYCALDCTIDASLLDDTIAALMQLVQKPSSCMVYGLFLGGCLIPIVGQILSDRVKRWVLRFVGLPVKQRSISEQDLVREIVQLSRQYEHRKRGLTNDFEIDELGEIRPAKLSRVAELELSDQKLILTVLHIIRSNVAFRKANVNLRSAEDLIHMLHPGEEFGDLFGSLHSRFSLARACPYVADALDDLLSEEIARTRNSTFHGCGFITDGASPTANKWSGLSFQITILVALFVPPIAQWEEQRYDERPPFFHQETFVRHGTYSE